MSGQVIDVAAWADERLRRDRQEGLPVSEGRSDITAVAYAFGTPERMPAYGRAIELALRESYRWCGLLRTTLVVNRLTAELETFAADCGRWLRVDVDETLRPGDIVGFSRNMIRTLPDRFDTPYLLNIHPDGFPLRTGLDDFVGQWDYIGGPWRTDCDDWITRRLLTRWDGAGNGGFALRTRKICELGASAYRRFWKMIPDCYLLYEDLFFTRFLPRWQPGYARQVSLAPRTAAAAFSFCENEVAQKEYGSLPFGFHSWKAFNSLVEAGVLNADEFSIVGQGSPQWTS